MARKNSIDAFQGKAGKKEQKKVPAVIIEIDPVQEKIDTISNAINQKTYIFFRRWDHIFSLHVLVFCSGLLFFRGVGFGQGAFLL